MISDRSRKNAAGVDCFVQFSGTQRTRTRSSRGYTAPTTPQRTNTSTVAKHHHQDAGGAPPCPWAAGQAPACETDDKVKP